MKVNIKSVIKYSFKFVLVLSCVSGVILTSTVSDLLAANAIITSDSSLNFDNKKLEMSLTNISNKSDLGVVFYSINTLSPNVVDNSNGIKVNKAIFLNDLFIGSIKTNNYITLFYNKDSVNTNKGSFSVNVGADYRSVIDKEYITKEIVNPNIKKFLPQNPEAFILVVSQLIVDRVNSVNSWNRTVGISITLGLGLLIFGIVYYVIRYLVKTLTTAYKNAKDVYENTSKSLQQLELVYKELATNDPYLKGYEGQTMERANCLRYDLDLVILDKEYVRLLVIPKFKYCLFGTSTWANYSDTVDNKLGKWTRLNKDISEFFERIKGINSLDPLAELEKIEEEKKKQLKLQLLLDTAQSICSSVYEHTKNNQGLLKLYHEVKAATNLEERQSKFNVFNDVMSKEIELINNFKEKRANIDVFANYIISNNNKYSFGVISKVNKDWAIHLLHSKESLTDYKKDHSAIYDIAECLHLFVKDYTAYDVILIDFNKEVIKLNREKDTLISYINDFSNKFKIEKEELIRDIKAINIKLDKTFDLASVVMISVLSRYKNLLKKNTEYTSRKDKIYAYSSYRSNELNRALDLNNYAEFDRLLNQYKLESTNTINNRSYYSSTSYSSSSSDNNSSSSNDSSSSSNDSWSSSSSSDSSSSDSSSSDSSW